MNSPDLPFAPAAERNRVPILEALAPRLAVGSRVLEIGSGTGQHAVAFSRQLQGVHWQPTELPENLPGLAARVVAEGGPGLCPPVALDVASGPWPAGPFEAAYTANTTHIMGWAAVCAMVAGVGDALVPGGAWFIYGPFRRAGHPTAESNERFDAMLREQDPRQGLREIEALESEAKRHQMRLEEVLELPANNLFVVMRKRNPAS